MVPGQQIAPTLTLVRPLAKGSMGSVWVADHLALGTQVAVKFMSPSLAGDPDLVARFQQEAMAAARIKSPHVAQVFDHGIAADGSPYIVMELLEGESLGRHIAQRGPLPPGEVAQIVAQAAKALARAHRLGIVHRDIKPDNLFLVDLDGELFVKVLDFGVAKQGVDAGPLGLTSTGILVGTPLYMSPEQTRSARRVDHRADVWSLGAVAYHALTGKPPFTGPSMAALLFAVNEGTYAPPSQLRPELPPEVDAWVARALQRDPEARFGSAVEMAEALSIALRVPVAAQATIAPTPEAQPEAAGPVSAPPGSASVARPELGAPWGASGLATAPSPGLQALRGYYPLLIAAAALGAGLLVALAVWVAGGDDASGTTAEEAKGATAQGAPAQGASAAPGAQAGEAPLPATAGPVAPPDPASSSASAAESAPAAESPPPAGAAPPSTSAPASRAPAEKTGGAEAAEPRPARSARPWTRKKKEDDIGF